MSKPIKILHLEDLPTDAELIERVLKKGDFEFERCLVDNKHDYEVALKSFCPDIIISDHSLPSFDSLEALSLLKEKKINIPFILVTSAISEEFAVLIMKQGADDYILKDRLQRLPNAVISSLEKKRIEIEHQKFLDELIFNEALLKETEHLANIGSFKVDLVNNIVQWSDQLYSILNYKQDEITASQENFLKRVHQDDLAYVVNAFASITAECDPVKIDYRIVTENKAVKFIHTEIFFKCNEGRQAILATGFTQDITQHKKAEEKTAKAYRLYAFISQINQAIIHAINEKNVFKEVCQIAINTGKFKMAWVGLLDTERKKINLVEEYGAHPEDIERFTDASYEKNQAKDYVAKMGTYYVSNNIKNEPALVNSGSFALERGFGSCIMLPIKKEDVVYGILNLYASETNFFDLEEIKLLEEVANNISFAVNNFEKEIERKRAEEQLAHSEATLKEAQAIAHIGNWEMDLSAGTTKWSEETCRIYGIHPEDNIHAYDYWLSFIHPDDLDEVLKKSAQARESYSNLSLHYRIITKNGTIKHIYSKTRLQFNTEGELVGINGVAHDVTESKKNELMLKEKELYLRGILDSTNNGIIAVDNNNTLINFNNSFAELWKISPEFVLEGGRDKLIAYCSEQLINPEILNTNPYNSANAERSSFDLLKFKDGRVVERSSTPLILNNSYVGKVWSFNDITERSKHLLAIEEQNKKLKEIAWIQSHVVRAPLSRIMGLIDILKNNPRGKLHSAELLDYILTSGNELDDVIRSIVSKTEEVTNLDAIQRN